MAANSQFSMAVHVLTLLALSDGSNLKSDEIAASVNTNPVVIRRLLGQLANSGLVASQMGASGGSRLAIPADRIHLAEIYRAVCCGEIFALHGAPNRECPVGAHIEAVLCRLQKEIDLSIDSKLSEYSLADVIREVESV
jgi:Rrf2 family protein